MAVLADPHPSVAAGPSGRTTLMITVDADTMQAANTLALAVTLGHVQFAAAGHARGTVDTERREVWSA